MSVHRIDDIRYQIELITNMPVDIEYDSKVLNVWTYCLLNKFNDIIDIIENKSFSIFKVVMLFDLKESKDRHILNEIMALDLF